MTSRTRAAIVLAVHADPAQVRLALDPVLAELARHHSGLLRVAQPPQPREDEPHIVLWDRHGVGTGLYLGASTHSR